MSLMDGIEPCRAPSLTSLKDDSLEGAEPILVLKNLCLISILKTAATGKNVCGCSIRDFTRKLPVVSKVERQQLIDWFEEHKFQAGSGNEECRSCHRRDLLRDYKMIFLAFIAASICLLPLIFVESDHKALQNALIFFYSVISLVAIAYAMSFFNELCSKENQYYRRRRGSPKGFPGAASENADDKSVNGIILADF